ncbi:hypothetical protein HY642_03790 [Candidatus Woesearchaeota archaeon]|nr:hypothetical protein [Candidatus Woesearchaeota archaeon]
MTLHTLGTPKPGKYDPNLAERLNKEADEEAREERKGSREAAPRPAPVHDDLNFRVQDHKEFWRVNGVSFKKNIYTVDLLKQPLNGGRRMKPGQWMQLAGEADSDAFTMASAPMHHALFTALNRNHNASQYSNFLNQYNTIVSIRCFLACELYDGVYTHTCVGYSQAGPPDSIFHDFGMPTQRRITTTMTGQPGAIKYTQDAAAIKALLGTNNLSEVNDIYSWIIQAHPIYTSITPGDPWFHRLEARPAITTERQVALCNGISVDSTVLGVTVDYQPERAALGIRAKKIGNIP